MRLFRRKSMGPPREGWVECIDSEGRVLARTPVVVNDVDPLNFTVNHAVDFRDLQQPGTITAIRVVDADGNSRTVPLA